MLPRYVIALCAVLGLAACNGTEEEFSLADGGQFFVCTSAADSRAAAEISVEREYWAALSALDTMESRSACGLSTFSAGSLTARVLSSESDAGVEVRFVEFRRSPSSWPTLAPGQPTLYTCLLSETGSGRAARWTGCELVILERRTVSGILDFLGNL
ncbi:MAG: hypothetical protein AAF914_13860 [Pseudomonadota bacterium]